MAYAELNGHVIDDVTSKRTSLSWSVAAMVGLDGSGVADGL